VEGRSASAGNEETMGKAVFLGTYVTRGPVPGQDNRTVKSQMKQYWFVWQDSVANVFLIQKLDSRYRAEGEPVLLPTNTFRSAFSREPRVTVKPDISPDVADYLDKAFALGRKPAQTVVTGKPSAAKARLALSPEMADREMRAAFARNIMRFRRGDLANATAEFKEIAAITENIIPAHKHTFTDFGINLRKSHLFDAAVSHFQRVVELAPDDSHAQFNLARILYETGGYQKAAEHARKALDLEPELSYARRLLEQAVSKLRFDRPEMRNRQ
jgi:tetratricopeptide (TPR) repeat protein